MNHIMAHVGCLVCNVAMGEIGKSYQRRVENWLKINGPEWTSKRCKALWNAALLLREGDTEGAQALYRSNSIAYRKTDWTPKGPEGRVVREFVKAQRPAVLKRISAVLRIYCSIRLDEPSKSQVSKAIRSIAGPYTGELSPSLLRHRGYTAMSCFRGADAARRIMSRPLGQNEIHAEHLHVNSRYYSRNPLPKEMKAEPYVSMAMSFMTEPWLPDSIDRLVPCREMREHDRSQGWGDSQLYAGRITLLQEQGAKARVVCQPSAWLQLGFMPLHNRLAQLVKALFPKESCVDDQPSGMYAVLAHMKAGNAAYCTDLSSATDRFPVQYSLGVLDALGAHQYASAMEEVVKRKFQCSFSPTGELVYSVGQPMGLYSSFPLFHLSNALVAESAWRDGRFFRKGEPETFPDGSHFKVLGDDIIFPNAASERMYRKTMKEFGVQISESKCFHGPVCEFAGFLALRTNKTVIAFRPYKVPDADHVTNPIQFLDSLGANVRKLRDPKWGKLFQQYQLTVTSRDLDLSPLLPTWEEDPVPDVRGDNATLVRLCQGLQMWAPDYKYSLPDPSLDATGRPTTRINTEPLFRERGLTDRYVFDREYLMSQDYRESEKHPDRRNPVKVSKDPLMAEARLLLKGAIPKERRLIAAPVLPRTTGGVVVPPTARPMAKPEAATKQARSSVTTEPTTSKADKAELNQLSRYFASVLEAYENHEEDEYLP